MVVPSYIPPFTKEAVLPLYPVQSSITPRTVGIPLTTTRSSSNPTTYVGDIKPENAETVATRKYPIPSPTVLFLKPAHLSSIVSGILQAAKKSWFLYSFAWRHKLAGVTDGFITNQSLWDRLVFDGARAKTLGNGAATIREVIVSGGMFASSRFFSLSAVKTINGLQVILRVKC